MPENIWTSQGRYSLINSDRVLTPRFVKDAGLSLCVPLCFMSWFTASSVRQQRPGNKHKNCWVVFKQTSVMHLSVLGKREVTVHPSVAAEAVSVLWQEGRKRFPCVWSMNGRIVVLYFAKN